VSEELHWKWHNFIVSFTDALCNRWSFDDCITWSRWCFYGWT